MKMQLKREKREEIEWALLKIRENRRITMSKRLKSIEIDENKMQPDQPQLQKNNLKSIFHLLSEKLASEYRPLVVNPVKLRISNDCIVLL